MPLPCALSIGSAAVLAVCSAAANATGPDRVEPGQWRTVVTYTSVTGLPPPMIRAMTARPHAFDGCTTDGDITVYGDGSQTPPTATSTAWCAKRFPPAGT